MTDTDYEAIAKSLVSEQTTYVNRVTGESRVSYKPVYFEQGGCERNDEVFAPSYHNFPKPVLTFKDGVRA